MRQRKQPAAYDLPNQKTPRRAFTRGLVASITAPLILSKQSAFGYPANDRLNLAIVGVAGYAAATAFMPAIHIYDNVHISALCDVDQRKVDPALKVWHDRAKNWPNSQKPDERRAAEHYLRLVETTPPLIADYRQMIEQLHEQIDAVVVATPDHSHAAPAALALRADKHVLCEKPLTITVHEARALRQLAAEHRVATSLGNQGTQSPQFRRGLEIIREGILGPVEQVHVWFDRGGRNHKEPPQETQPVPKELNWDLWLGPVAWREYHPGWIARTHWRETSAGELGNFGPHTANLAFLALEVANLWQAGKTDTPIRVEAECSETNRLSFPRWERIVWQVPARGELPAVRFTWHQGPGYAPGSRELFEQLLREHGASGDDIKKLLLYAGAMIIGSQGILVTDSHNVNITLLPKERFAGVATDKPKTVEASQGHYRDWINACRGGPSPWARFEYAATFNEFLMLGDIATRFPGSRLEYDPLAGAIKNHTEGNQALSYEYRQGWRL